MSLCNRFSIKDSGTERTRERVTSADGVCHLYLFQLMEANGEDIAHLRTAIECFEREGAPEIFLNSLREIIKEAEK